MKKKFKTIRCSETTFEQLDYIAKCLNQKKSAFLDELFTYLFDIFSDLENASILYTSAQNKLIICAFGKSRVIFGVENVGTQATKEEVDAKVKEKVEESIESLRRM